MESVETFFDEELDSLKRMFFNMDADHFTMQQRDHDMFSSDRGNGMDFETSNLLPACEAIDNASMASFYESLFSCNNINTNSCSYFTPESSISSGNDNNVFFTNPNNGHNQANDVNILNVITNAYDSSSMEFFAMDNKCTESSVIPVLSDDAMEDFVNAKEEMMINGNAKSGNGDCQAMTIPSGKQQQLKRKMNPPEDESSYDYSDNPKKKCRVSKDTQKSTRRNAQPKKKKKILRDSENDQDENENNAGQNLQSPSSSMSEDDSNALQELSGGETSDLKGSAAVKSNARTRATRGSATDPQSLYARKRRERINERLKILQNLVPNGTKVDISTMLEEAVHYVKFLQLQIKLLSSDEMWMYAPIAYNGMDIGVYQRMLPSL